MCVVGAKGERNAVRLWPNPRSRSCRRGFGSKAEEIPKLCFPVVAVDRLSADGVQHLLARHVAKARETCASLRKKRVSPHVLRHAAAMELLQAGVDRAVIALWLGHESVETTQIYLDADLALKEQPWPEPIRSKAPPSAINRTTSCSPFSNNSNSVPPDYAAS